MSISLAQLQQATHEFNSPLQLQVDDRLLDCQQLVRLVPGKRLVFLGTYNDSSHVNEKVIIKLFVHPSRAKKHWLREFEGAKLLQDNGIATPENIAGGIADKGIYFLVFRFIDGQDLASFWHTAKLDDKVNKLRTMLPTLAQHHRLGLAHQDLHYGNFFLGANDVIYTLDGEEIKSGPSPLKKSLRLKNLALFLAQTFDVNKLTALSVLQEYCLLADMVCTSTDCQQFWQWIRNFHQQRIEQYLKKIVRECTEVRHQKNANGYSLCRRDAYSEPVKQLLAQPEVFFNDEHSQYLKQGNTCTVKSVRVNNERYVIKRYNPKGVTYELMHKGQSSRARKSWINAHLLRFMGISTPRPIALIEQQPALGQRCSYFVSEYTDGQNSWDFFCDSLNDDSVKRSMAQQLVSLLKRLCDYHISHGDLKGSNFLVSHNTVWLLDLDALTRHKSLWQFSKSWHRDRRRFLKNWNKKACYEPWKQFFNTAFSEANSHSVADGGK